MNKSKLITLMCIAFSVLLMGCQASSTTKDVLYENSEVGIVIYESKGWVLDNESTSGVWNATFSNETIKANITKVPGNRKMNEIKSEVYLQDHMTIVEETETYLSLKTNKEGIQTDIYTEHVNNETVLLTFVATDSTFDSSGNVITDFKSNIEISK